MDTRLGRALMVSLLVLTWIFIIAAVLGITRDLAEAASWGVNGLAYAP